MASSFLEKMAKKQAEELEKKYGSSAYGGTTWLEERLNPSRKTTMKDIAPVAKKEEERTWFDTGAFDDGYQFGDVTKTILGTVGDIGENIATGVAGMGEKALDALMFVAPYVAQGQYYQNGGGFNIQADQAFNNAMAVQKEASKEFIKKDLYDEQKVAETIIDNTLLGRTNKALGIDSKTHSVFGEKTDALAQSGGQLLATAGLQAVGVPWFVTTGLTSYGSEVEGALNTGASYEEAGLSAAVTAGAEILTEKLSGGIKFGGKALDDALTKEIARGISNKTVRTLAKLGLDMAGEGSEEVLSGVMSAIGQKLTYADDKELEELFSSEEALESFIGGAVLGGVSSGVNAVKSKSQGIDPVPELTANEQKVVDRVYNDRVAEAEKNGKVSQKKKSEIYDSVLRDLEKGYISTDTIEDILGDKSSYDALSQEAEEFKTLYETEGGKLSEKQRDRLAELKEKNKVNPYETALKESKDQFSQSVFELVKGDRLSESYNERSRRGQTFEADLTQYDAKQQAVVQKAIDSGVLNNTNRSHELVDLIAKVASDKDLDFDFTNNEKIKGTQFAVEGKIVNGYVTDSGITLNVESPKYLESTVGHEITHVLEGTELYSALQQTIFDYAKSKGEYDSRLADLTELYKDVKGTNIEAELTADLVGDYLFQDSEFINRLSTENRNVFRKIYDEIKYLCRVVTAGSKEARELEKVKKAFEDAYRANGKAEGGTKFSLTDKTKPTYEELVAKNPVQIVNVKGGIESGSYTDMKTATMKKATSEGWFDVPHHNTDTDSLIFITEKSFSHAYSNLRSDFGEDTIRCMAHIPEIIQNAVLVSVDDPRDPTKQETKVYTFFGAIEGVGGIEPVKLTVKEYDFSTLDAVPKNIRSYFEKNGVMKSYDSLYDAHALEVIGIEGIKKESDASGKVYEQGSEAQATSDSIINIADLLNLVKGDATKYIPKKQYSLSDAKPTADKDIRYSISGINARTANSSMLLRAEHMLNAGADSETVRQETGWYKGYDGKMRFEIDDSKSELIDNPDLEKHDKDGTTYFTGKLADILNHEDLYEAYPQLRNVNIIIQETEPGTRGIYQPNSNYLTLSLELFKRHTKEYEAYLNGDRKAEIERIEQTPEYREYNKWYEDEELSEKLSPEKWLEEEAKARDKFFNSDLGKRYYQLKWGKVNIQKSEFGWGKEAKEVLMHEIQHAIQKIEDFARGSNPGYWRRVLASGDTIQTAEQKAELREAENKLYEIYKQNPEFYTEMTELLSTAPDMPRGKVDWDTLEQIEEDPIEWQEFDKKRDALEEKYGSLEVFDFFDLHHDVERYRKRSLDADDAYYSTAGEIEARDTANRLNLTAEERRNKRPDIDKKRVVFTDRYSLSDFGEQPRRYGDRATLGKDVELAPLHDEIGPVAENATTVSKTESVAPVVISKNETTTNVTPEEMQAMFPDDLAPNELDVLVQEKENLENRMMEMGNTEDFTDFETVNARYTQVLDRIAELEGAEAERVGSLTDADIPPEKEAVRGYKAVTAEDPFAERSETAAGDRSVKAYQYENPEVKPFFREAAYALAEDINLSIPAERWYNDDLYYASGGEKGFGGNSRLTAKDVGDFKDQWKCSWDDLREAVNDIIEDHGKENNALSKRVEFLINDRLMYGYTNIRGERIEPNQAYLDFLKEKQINEYSQEAREAFFANADRYAPVAEESPVTDDVAPTETSLGGKGVVEGQQTYISTESKLNNRQPQQGADDVAPTYPVEGKKGVPDGQQAFMPEQAADEKIARKQLQQNIVDKVKNSFKAKGFDFDKVLKTARNLSTFATVDNTPQRVMEKALGYKEGQILSDLTVNQVAQNETSGIRWLNSFTDRKNGLLAQISKQYHIKPGSKESAAAQMYAEGYYVKGTDKNGEYVKGESEIVQYGDVELAADFPDPKVQKNIKGLARDPRIRQIYDQTLEAINASRKRNAYPEIPRLDNYFLHFRAMEDTFSRLGLPFNPNDIRAKDLPTDLNGVTADLKPGQPYFASAMHRTGKRTSFDLLGGLEKYLTSAKNQIYHIDDIQTLRALRNYIADTYGQANGLEGLDALSEEEAQDRIAKVYKSHLSTFAKFLNEEANILAGKTALIDRGFEGIIGRRGITFLDTVNKQVGSNMVGFNISSSLTNFLPVAQTLAKTNKFDFVKAFAQTAANKVGSVFGRTDGFTENSPVIIRRKGADRFYRTLWQKAADPGYALMGAVDDISTELIARTKYNELTRKGMDSQKAHIETDKWVSRLMGDRSLGQQPQLYNSKMLGLITKFQLEVRNQLDSQFYDTIQETKASNQQIQNGLLRNAKTAAKVASTFVQLAAVQHLFGKAFESVAGYNPAFDIIEVIIKACGWDDEEDSEDTVLDNIEQGFFALLEDLPYTSTLTGGRIPIESALPIEQFVTGKDQYGNEKSRWETLGEVAPYYILPGGYGQVKKTVQGLGMFSDDHPITGSYTDSGNLRFPVEDTVANRVQAGIFGQYANDNARYYFDNDIAPLKEKQIQEYIDSEMPIRDYWDYREGLKMLDKQDEKIEYINGLDVTEEQKDVLKAYVFDEEGYAKDNPEKYAFLEKEGIGYLGWKQLDDETQEAWSWAFKHQDKYNYFKGNGVFPEDYSVYHIPMVEFDDEDNNAYMWAIDNPENATVGRVFSDGVKEYRRYTNDLYNIKAEKDENGKSISGSRKEKVIEYINGLDVDYGAKLILFKAEYPATDDYNYEIVEYLNSRDDISYEDTVTILTELGFTVSSDGTVTWD